MIVLDAGVLIALFDANDAHHKAAEEIYDAHVDEEMTIGPINQAEALVRAAREGRADEMLAHFEKMEISTTTLPTDAGVRLAKLCARTGTKIPDCCVLLTAQQTSARIATFDDRLNKIAISLGLDVVDKPF